MRLVIVESPAKAKTINKYLGNDYQVIASYGHIRSIPSRQGAVRPEEDFAMDYEILEKSGQRVKEISKACRSADSIFLATDPDREGESISWHIVEAMKESKALNKNKTVKRIVFNEITKKAVMEAIANPRDIDMSLVEAQQARQALDYLVGFNLSSILWRKLPGSRSAGRVQSVALRLICERENEVETFISQEYWGIKLALHTPGNELFSAMLTHLDQEKLDKFFITNQDDAEKIAKRVGASEYFVESIDKKEQKRNPQAPFNTSSLQQDASRKLGFSTKRTMQIAQKLYEGMEVNGTTVGLITYMRTDGVQLSDEAVKGIRGYISQNFGKEYLSKEARIYQTKTKNAQEAHEAIRPTNIELTPAQVKGSLSDEAYKLYELIWQRTIASQMKSAILEVSTVTVSSKAGDIKAKATGSIIVFLGFYKIYREGLDEDSAKEESKLLPLMKEKDDLRLDKVTPEQHFTEPPARYTEASLVKKLEELGIGRPSTYSTIISVLQDRNYVRFEKKRFIPEERGRLVTAFLQAFFTKYVEYNFTADMENQLDAVSNGELAWKKLLGEFWREFFPMIEGASGLTSDQIIPKLEDMLSFHLFGQENNRNCLACADGKLHLKTGKFGVFLACSNYPDCRYTKKIEETGEETSTQENYPKSLGTDPESGLDISVRKGPYGYYVQLGGEEMVEAKGLKRAGLLPYISPDTITLEQALTLLSLPREIGLHPESKEVIKAGYGKFGPYLIYQKKFYSLPKDEDVLTIGLNRALTLLEGSKEKAPRFELIREIGQHPESKEMIAIYNGRFGPFIKYGKTNISLRKLSPDTITLEEALELIASNPSSKGKKTFNKKKGK